MSGARIVNEQLIEKIKAQSTIGMGLKILAQELLDLAQEGEVLPTLKSMITAHETFASALVTGTPGYGLSQKAGK